MDRRSTRIHIGTRDWRYPDDASGFYPEDLPEDWQLETYSTQFHFLEVPPLDAFPEAERMAFLEEETLEDALLSLPLAGSWAERLARGGDLLPLARALAPVEEKLGVILWPRKPPLAADSYWPGALHLDAGADPLPRPDDDADGDTYWHLAGPGRYAPQTLEAFAGRLVARAERGWQSYVVFAETAGGKAVMDAGLLQEAVERIMG
jgi:hypothetical protein